MESQPVGRVFNKIIAQEFGIPSSSVFKLIAGL
jgi:hypothetical protein